MIIMIHSMYVIHTNNNKIKYYSSKYDYSYSYNENILKSVK